ncbi:TetR/AcrR family transcriptional regulator [Mycobacterium sp. D16Q16]|uniref:TetR/AcrR family transcriptional regulator n=1 Tax=Mycobacterium sp. D16Q16 TaxID=1855659 RepID=UPI000993955C|nr:TetR/AcrR family transcriptional regulator [Mycobacterium sp. D16Q16]
MASTNGDRRGPGRPPNPQRARERQRTLTEAAALEFAEKGYHKASITDITQRAGVGRATFYLYFDTKRDALDAVIDSYFQRTLAAVNDTSDLSGNAGDFEQHLRTVFTRLFDMLDNSPEIMQVILREGLLDSAMTKRMFGILDLIESVNITIIEQARADGTITSAIDAAFLAHAITGLSMAATLKAVRGELAGDARETYIDSFIELVRSITTVPPALANS